MPLDLSVGNRLDQGKPRTDLIAPDAMLGLSNVLAYGANKYADRNWEKGMKWGRVFGSLLRHAWAFWRGEDYDPETGLPHTDHILCNAMFLSAYFHRKIGEDDRNAVYSEKPTP